MNVKGIKTYPLYFYISYLRYYWGFYLLDFIFISYTQDTSQPTANLIYYLYVVLCDDMNREEWERYREEENRRLQHQLIRDILILLSSGVVGSFMLAAWQMGPLWWMPTPGDNWTMLLLGLLSSSVLGVVVFWLLFIHWRQEV